MARDRPSTRLNAAAWGVWAVAIAAAVLGGVLSVPATGADRFLGGGSLPSVLASIGVTAAYVTVGLVIVRRQRGHIVGWLFAAQGLLLGLNGLSFGYARHAMHAAGTPDAPGALAAAWISTVFLITPVWIAAVLLILLFPNGRPPSDRWRVVGVAIVASALVLALALAVAPGPLPILRVMNNPLGVGGVPGMIAGVVVILSSIVIVACAVSAAIGMVYRYRGAASVERQQLKWFAYGAFVMVAGGTFYGLLGRVPDARLSVVAQDVAWIITAACLAVLPIAALVAMQRYRLYDVDTLIGRTIVYGTLTALVAGVYTASVRLSTVLFETVTGEASDIGLVITTLVVATSFTPIKARLEAAVARRFKDSSAGADATAAGSRKLDEAELDRRMEKIARRVAHEVVDARGR